MAIQIFFILVAAVTLFSAGMVVSVRRMIHAALWLVLALFGVAVIFATLEASFFAVVQVLVYIGAIAILVIFAVMLTRHVMEDDASQTNRGWLWALFACLALFGVLGGISLVNQVWQVGPGIGPNALLISDFGRALVNPEQYAIPFEVASVLLLAALVGSIYVAVERKGAKG
jgi:NADH-quinone oxidoreductase subunit J